MVTSHIISIWEYGISGMKINTIETIMSVKMHCSLSYVDLHLSF